MRSAHWIHSQGGGGWHAVIVYVVISGVFIAAVGAQLSILPASSSVPQTASSTESVPFTAKPPTSISAGSYASECKVWSGVSKGLLSGRYSGNETVCNMNGDCSGFSCTDLNDKQSSGFPRENLFSFGVEIDECSYPLKMTVHLKYMGSTKFDQSLNVQSSGAVSHTLPQFNGDRDSVRQLSLKWESVLRPIRYHVDLQVNYTIMRRTIQSMEILENILLVPYISVTIPDCRSLFDRKTTSAPGGQRVTPFWEIIPEIPTERSNEENRELATVMPLVIAVTVGILFLVLLLVVLLHRRRFAARLTLRRGGGSFGHSKLINDDYITDDHVLQI